MVWLLNLSRSSIVLPWSSSQLECNSGVLPVGFRLQNIIVNLAYVGRFAPPLTTLQLTVRLYLP